MKRVILASLLLAMAACGSESEPNDATAPVETPPVTATPMADAEKAAAQELTAEQKAEIMRNAWAWPEDGGPSRDLEDDVGQCQSDIEKDERFKGASDFVRLLTFAKCMQDLGWVKADEG